MEEGATSVTGAPSRCRLELSGQAPCPARTRSGATSTTTRSSSRRHRANTRSTRHWGTRRCTSGPRGRQRDDADSLSGGHALVLYNRPGLTIREIQAGAFDILVALDRHGKAIGSAYFDDGESLEPATTLEVTLSVAPSGSQTCVTSTVKGDWRLEQPVAWLTILGVATKPESLTIDGQRAYPRSMLYDGNVERLKISLPNTPLDAPLSVCWD